jgi:rhodanese-related sulfurtransferase
MQTSTAPSTPRFSRRKLLIGGTAAVTTGGVAFASKWFNIFADVTAEGMLTAEIAYKRAETGEIYLLDIRRPDEWQRTGVAGPAIPLDMRRDDFEIVIQSIFDASGVRPVALICARGVRSDRMNARLASAGFADILDVPEGMLGSGAGIGYIERGLPLRDPTDAELNGNVA